MIITYYLKHYILVSIYIKRIESYPYGPYVAENLIFKIDDTRRTRFRYKFPKRYLLSASTNIHSRLHLSLFAITLTGSDNVWCLQDKRGRDEIYL